MQRCIRSLALLTAVVACRTTFAYTLELATNKSCYQVGETVTVAVWMKNVSPTPAAGFQAFLAYDPSKLSFVSWAYTPAPFGTPVLNSLGVVNPSAGLVNLASGIDIMSGQSPSNVNAVLAVLTFTAVGPDACTAQSVWFRNTGSDPPNPSTRLSSLGGVPLLPLTKTDAANIAIDSSAPSIACPGDVAVECHDSVAPANTGSASAADNCTVSPTVAYSDLYSAPIASGGATLSSPAGWSFQSQNTARGALVAGPGTPPLGTGSFHMITGPGGPPGPTGGKIWLTTSFYNGMRLADIATFSYSTFVTAGDPGIAPAINLYVDLDGNGSRDTTLVFEPVYVVAQQGPVVHGAWQTWNTLNGPGWWYTVNFGPLTNRLNEFQPLSYYLGLYPNAQIVAWGGDPRGMQFVAGQNSQGAPWSNFDGNVDNVVVNSDVHNFDPGAAITPRCSATLERTWTATDCSGNSASCTQSITVSDSTPPAIACPSNITVGTNGGICSASDVFIGETFSSPVSTCASQTFNCWYTDRYAPAVFATALFSGDQRLHQQISAADSYSTRPGPYQNIFYNTQGRKLDINRPIGSTISVDLYIPSSWATDARRADLWATAFDMDGQISGYPIVGFIANDPANPFESNPAPANVVPRFRVYTQDTDQNPGNGYTDGWVELGLPGGFTYDQWVTLKIALNPGSLTFTVVTAQGNLTFNDSIVFGTTLLGNLMLQGYNFSDPGHPVGDTYDIYWDNLGVPALASDNCDVAPTVAGVRSDAQPLTAPYPVGTTTIIWTATDCSGHANNCSQTVTVLDDDAPSITCPGNVTVDCGGLTDPPATGSATASDNCPGVAITYSDDRAGLTGCNATGTIVRTWTATDAAGNSTSCTQNVTLVDTADPILTGCSGNISVTPPAGFCSATVAYPSGVAVDVCYDESFENPQFVAGAPSIGASGGDSVNWNRYNSAFNRVPSGTDGITSKTGGFHAVIDSSSLPASPDDYTGAFNRLRGYSSNFGDGFRVTQAIYLDVNDPAVAADTYGWDLSAAVNTPSNSHRRDFIFHASGKLGGGTNRIVIAGSNNSNFTRRNDLLSLNHYVVSSSGWYTFEWVFRDSGGGVLAVDLNLRDSSDSLLWTETRSDPSDIIGSTVGGNRYLWFTFLEVQRLAIDDSRLIRNVSVACSPVSGSSFPVGVTPVTCTATDECLNSSSCAFNVTVSGSNDFQTSVELSPTINTGGSYPQSLTRCISFEFYNGPSGPTTVDWPVTFTKASPVSPMIANNVLISIPCGTYTCVTARDRLHTLRRTANALTIDLSGRYNASFTGDPAGGGDWLIGGNLNDDFYIDILDFGVWASQYTMNFGTGDTNCATAAPHSDISGDGIVHSADFLYIQLNFFKTHEANCVGAPGLLLNGANNNGPISAISVAELNARGMADLAAGDVNGDGMLDVYDIVWLLAGNTPQPHDPTIVPEPATTPTVAPTPRKAAEQTPTRLGGLPAPRRVR